MSRNIPNLIITLGILVLVGFVVWFIASRFSAFIKGPNITVEYPANGATIDTSFTRIKGSVKRSASFSINGNTILPTTGGDFSYPLLLSPGYSIIKLQAKDRFGHTEKTYLHLYHPASSATTTLQPTTTEATTSNTPSSPSLSS